MKKLLFLFLALGAVIGTSIFMLGVDAGFAAFAISPMIAGMSRTQLEEMAEGLLSNQFDGFDDLEDEYEGYDDDDLYDGYEDPEVSFLGSATSFVNEKRSGVFFNFKIVNNSGYDKVVCLNPAYFDTTGITLTSKDGYLSDAVINHHNISEIIADGHSDIEAVISDGLIYGTSGAGITVTGLNGKIRSHLAFVYKNATRITKITLSSVLTATGATDTTMYNQILKMRRVSPYNKFGDTNIDLYDFFKTQQFQSGKIEIDTAMYNMQADDQTLIFIMIPNALTVNFKFDIGGIGNSASKFFKKATKAVENIQKGSAGKIPAEKRKAYKKAVNNQMQMMRRIAFKRK